MSESVCTPYSVNSSLLFATWRKICSRSFYLAAWLIYLSSFSMECRNFSLILFDIFSQNSLFISSGFLRLKILLLSSWYRKSTFSPAIFYELEIIRRRSLLRVSSCPTVPDAVILLMDLQSCINYFSITLFLWLSLNSSYSRFLIIKSKYYISFNCPFYLPEGLTSYSVFLGKFF